MLYEPSLNGVNLAPAACLLVLRNKTENSHRSLMTLNLNSSARRVAIVGVVAAAETSLHRSLERCEKVVHLTGCALKCCVHLNSRNHIAVLFVHDGKRCRSATSYRQQQVFNLAACRTQTKAMEIRLNAGLAGDREEDGDGDEERQSEIVTFA